MRPNCLGREKEVVRSKKGTGSAGRGELGGKRLETHAISGYDRPVLKKK